MKFNGYSDEETCGKRVSVAGISVAVACLRTQGHVGECIAMAGDAGAADGVHFCCRTRLDLDHHAQCPLLYSADGKYV